MRSCARLIVLPEMITMLAAWFESAYMLSGLETNISKRPRSMGVDNLQLDRLGSEITCSRTGPKHFLQHRVQGELLVRGP